VTDCLTRKGFTAAARSNANFQTADMEHQEGTFSGYQNLSLYYQCWLPDTDPRAILLVVHGLAEHSGRYVNLADYFVHRGYAVYGFDHRGHGRSAGRRGYVNHFTDYLDDLNTFVNIVRNKHVDTRIFMFGHSMGGTIGTAYAVNHQHRLAGLILSGATLKLDPGVSPVLTALAPLISMLLPRMGTVVIDASATSRDRAIVDAYVNDPLVYHGKISARLGGELIRTIRKLPSQLPEINLPTLIMHGTADRLSHPASSQMLYERIGSADKTLKLYDGFYHETFNEPEHEQVFSDMETWLETHT